jgi:transposase
LTIPRSTSAQWVAVTGLQPLVDALRDVVLGQQVIHADETTVQMLVPGSKKTHRSYVWAYATSQFSDLAAVVYDFSPSRAGEHASNFLQGWKGKLVCDDFGGYKASFELGVTEIGAWPVRGTSSSNCMPPRARSPSKPCIISSCFTKSSRIRDLEPDLRRRIRQENAVPMTTLLHAGCSPSAISCLKAQPSAEHWITA